MNLKNLFEMISKLPVEEQEKYIEIIASCMKLSNDGRLNNYSDEEILHRLSGISFQLKALVQLWGDYSNGPVKTYKKR